MKFLAIIPARKGSKTLKNKNFRKFNKKPLIHWTIKAAKNSKCFDKIIVSTDSPKIQNYSKKMKVDCPFLRKKKFSGDKSSMHEVVLDVLKYCEKKNYYPNVVVLLQPTSPLRDVKDIKKSCNIFKKLKPDSLVTITKISHNFNPENLYLIKKKFLINLDKKNKRLKQRQDLKTLYARNGASIYMTSIRKIKKYILGGKIAYHIMHSLKSVDINNKEEFKLAELIQKKLKYNL